MAVKNINEDGMYLASKAKQYTVLVDSRWVAEKLGKQHQHVLRDIRSILEPGSGFSEDFTASNFGRYSYKGANGKPCGFGYDS